MPDVYRKITEVCNVHPDQVFDLVKKSNEPLVLRGLVDKWPAVEAAKKSFENFQEYLFKFYSNDLLVTYYGEPEINGRVFYSEDFKGFNYKVARVKLKEVLDRIQSYSRSDRAPVYYVGSTMLDRWFPGFRGENKLTLDGVDPLVSIWLGNQSVISTHFDFPENVACNVVGRRRFTLFPPDQIDNLYIGPLDMTPSGRAVSLVDVREPDLEKFPKYSVAQKSALVAELDVGDALYLPSMWWHHVEGLDDFNVLVNFWWRDTPNYWGNPDYALQHAIMSLRNLPKEQKNAWKKIFDYYVFGNDESDGHIPEHAKGILGEMTEDRAKQIRTQLEKRFRS
ncbi:hypothetical protein TDB9533_02738 [Thalassocella blandensis]|nr:hypothetical protein TDB9533_02738 [Thalassocella blandensis]